MGLRVAGAAGGEQNCLLRSTYVPYRNANAVPRIGGQYVPAAYRRGCCARADTGEATARAFSTAAILQLALVVAVALERGSWLGRGSCSLQEAGVVSGRKCSAEQRV
jgi:hypothetical protein